MLKKSTRNFGKNFNKLILKQFWEAFFRERLMNFFSGMEGEEKNKKLTGGKKIKWREKDFI